MREDVGLRKGGWQLYSLPYNNQSGEVVGPYGTVNTGLHATPSPHTVHLLHRGIRQSYPK
jgi:hypothetical protein